MPLPENPLFTGADLTSALHRPIADDDVVTAEKIIWGRVKDLLKLDTRPAQLDDGLAGLVLEAGIIAFTNPEALTRYILEGEESIYDNGRWNEILEAIENGGRIAPGSPASPRGNFPRPDRYPDPAYGFRRRCW